jgi:hypothetical protein
MAKKGKSLQKGKKLAEMKTLHSSGGDRPTES